MLGEALRTVASPPPVWAQMSTAHIYGDPQVLCVESSAYGPGLAPGRSAGCGRSCGSVSAGGSARASRG